MMKVIDRIRENDGWYGLRTGVPQAVLNGIAKGEAVLLHQRLERLNYVFGLITIWNRYSRVFGQSFGFYTGSDILWGVPQTMLFPKVHAYHMCM